MMLSALNKKNLNSEIETRDIILDSISARLSLNKKNLNSEIETDQFHPCHDFANIFNSQ